MWPWGHVAVAYLTYVAILWLRGREQRLWPLIGLAVGSQLPDLVDKPLAWTFAVLPSGRSLMHSLLTAIVLIAVLYWFTRRIDRGAVAGAVGVGTVSHSLVDLGPDVVVGLAQGQWEQLQWTTYLVWPLLPAPPYPNDSSFAQHFLAFTLDPYVLVQFALFGMAVLVWVGSGAPGFGTVRCRLRTFLDRYQSNAPE